MGHKNDSIPGLSQLLPISGANIVFVMTEYSPYTRAMAISRITIFRIKKNIRMVGPKK